MSQSLVSMDQSLDDYLEHYGVKGMKWGVRKDRNSIGKKSNKSKSKSTDSNKANTKSQDKSSSSTTKHRSMTKLTEDEMVTRINNLTSKENDALNDSKMVVEAAKTVKGDTLDGPLKTILEFHPKGLEVANQAADNLGLSSNTTKSKQELEWDRWLSLTPEQRFSEMSSSQKREIRKREERIKAYQKNLNHDELTDDLIEDRLMHYGVKGMKWGVRRNLKKKPNASERAEYIAEKDAKWRSSVSNPKKAVRVAKRASREATKMTKELNSKYKKQGYKIGGNSLRKNNLDNRRNKLARTQYDTELKGILEYSLDKAALKVYKNSPTRLYQVNLSRNSDGTLKAKVAPRQNAKLDKQRAAITKRNMRIKHSDEVDDVVDLNGLEFELTQDSDGFVTSVGVPGDDLEHTDLLSVKMKDISPDYLAHYQASIDLDDYLMHYGVKGMKWGVRRTPEQLGHRVSKSSSNLKKKVRSVVGADARTKRKIARTRRKARVEVAKLNAERAVANAKAKQEADAKKRAEASSPQSKPGSNTQTTAISKRKGTAGLSDDELRYAVSRMNLEKNYAQLIAESTPKTNKQKFNAWAKKTAIGMLETQAKQIINQVGSNTSKKLMDAISATADEAKTTPKPKSKPQPKPQSKPKPQPQPKPRPQSQPKPPPQDPPKTKPQLTPPPKVQRSQFGRVNEDAWRRYKSSGPTTSGPTSWRDGPSVIRDNLDEPIGTALELYDRRRRR